MKIWRETQAQTIGFELPGLPGDVFKLVIPELISDSKDSLLPWEHPISLDVSESSACCMTEILNVIRMEAKLVFEKEYIDIIINVTNLSKRLWKKVNIFTCFAFYSAPMFNDPKLERTFLPINVNEWKSIAELFAEHAPGDGPFTFFSVQNGPELSELWVYRQINQKHPQVVFPASPCVVSQDGVWVAGITTPSPAYVFNNRKECCLHAAPLLDDIKPGIVMSSVNRIYIFQGTPNDFMMRCKSDLRNTNNTI